MEEDLDKLKPLADMLAQFQKDGVVHVIMLCSTAVGHIAAYYIRHPNELDSPGLITGHAGSNAIMARNLAFALKRHAVNLGYNVDDKRHIIHVDEEHHAMQLLDFFTLIVLPTFQKATAVLNEASNG